MCLKKTLLLFMLASSLLLQGCGSKDNVSDIDFRFKLSDKVNIEEFKGYDGYHVEFYGYLSSDHADNDLLIMTVNPDGICPFHTDVKLDDYMAMPIRLKDKDLVIENTHAPLKIQGVLKSGEYTDKGNHSFELIVDDAVVTPVESENTEGILKTYIELAETGVFNVVREECVSIDEAFGYKIFGKELKDLKHVNIDKLKSIKQEVENREDDELNDLVVVIDYAIELGEFVNNALYKQDLGLLTLNEENNSDIMNKAYEMFNIYQNWQLKYSI